jgi:acetylornithine deacetylase/succinyl-diaminopimelate desuccinylase-like protein
MGEGHAAMSHSARRHTDLKTRARRPGMAAARGAARVLCMVAGTTIMAPPGVHGESARDVAERVRDWRSGHESQVLDELMGLLEIPNVAADRPSIQRNADALVTLLERRGARAEILENEPGPPAVLGEIRTPGAKKTVVFYAHYDGQPADPADWTTPPWEPTLRDGLLSDGARVLDDSARDGPMADDWRLYARSASDDKGPIVALLAALDALRDQGIPLSVSLKVFLEGEEEAGSPHLQSLLARYRDRLDGDVWLFGDGPVHQSGRVQVVYGVRGVMGLEITCYGPRRPLHSGHYGNWAPNPIAALAELLAGLRDSEGRIRIEGFYDDVEPPSDLARKALEEAPAPDGPLVEELALGRTEGGRGLSESLLLPALNLRGVRAAQVGEGARNVIPTEARASMDFRLVPGQTPERVRALVEDHLEKEGYHVVHADPDLETRRAHPRLVRLEWEEGYAAMGTPMDLPVARAVPEILDEALGESVVRVPLLGGSLPLAWFEEALETPLIVVPVVNHDNNQHAADENLRMGHLWRGIEAYAALLARLGHVLEDDGEVR